MMRLALGVLDEDGHEPGADGLSRTNHLHLGGYFVSPLSARGHGKGGGVDAHYLNRLPKCNPSGNAPSAPPPPTHRGRSPWNGCPRRSLQSTRASLRSPNPASSWSSRRQDRLPVAVTESRQFSKNFGYAHEINKSHATAYSNAIRGFNLVWCHASPFHNFCRPAGALPWGTVYPGLKPGAIVGLSLRDNEKAKGRTLHPNSLRNLRDTTLVPVMLGL